MLHVYRLHVRRRNRGVAIHTIQRLPRAPPDKSMAIKRI